VWNTPFHEHARHAHVRGAWHGSPLGWPGRCLQAPPKELLSPNPIWQEETSIFRGNIKAFFDEILGVLMRFFVHMLGKIIPSSRSNFYNF
jgi:hypothetical protein